MSINATMKVPVTYRLHATGTVATHGYSQRAMVGGLFDIVAPPRPTSQRARTNTTTVSTFFQKPCKGQTQSPIPRPDVRCPLTASSAANDLPSPLFTESGSNSVTSPSRVPFPVRNACITLCFVNFQYPVVASGCCGGDAVSWSHSRTMTSSASKGDACMIACARVNVGVNGFSMRRVRGLRLCSGSVFRALHRAL